MDQRTKQLRSQARLLDPTVHVGKQGASEGLIAQLAHELKRAHLVKIKILPSALPDEPSKNDRKALAAQLAQETGASVISVIGNTIVLHK